MKVPAQFFLWRFRIDCYCLKVFCLTGQLFPGPLSIQIRLWLGLFACALWHCDSLCGIYRKPRELITLLFLRFYLPKQLSFFLCFLYTWFPGFWVVLGDENTSTQSSQKWDSCALFLFYLVLYLLWISSIHVRKEFRFWWTLTQNIRNYALNGINDWECFREH